MPATRIRILHVEDVPADAELAERELRRAGFELDIRRVETREAFLSALQDFAPDLILSDYSLPEFDGMQALRLAKEHSAETPVIITTGSVNEETAVECMKAGAVDYVLKEQLGRLGTAVGSALERKRLEEEGRRAEQALRGSEDRYRSLFATSLDAVLLTTEGGEILAANAAACRMFGRSEEELMRGGRDGVVDRSDPRLPAALQERARTGTFHGEIDFLRRDRTKFTGEISSAVFMDRHGQPRTSMVIRDITDRRQLEAQLVQAQKMEAVGRLAGGVAHDFNNLLTVIQGYAELLRTSLADDPERRESVGEIIRAAERAAALTRQLLAFSRRQVLEMRVLDLGAVVADTEKMLRRLIGEDIEVIVVKPATLGSVKADPGQIEQVLVNLAVNSRDAMPSGGSLTLELADVTLDAPLTTSHDSIPPGRYVVVSVGDTGSGMDAETLAHIFEPFFTTKEQGKGTGLGLAMMYGIVKQTGGYVDVASTPGAGTTFRIYLPRSAGSMTSGLRPSVLSRHGTETVLLVEDEAAVRNLARTVLQRKGYVVLAAQDGAAALDLVDKHAGVIHVLLTDLVMPGMSGRDVAAAVRARRPSIKVIFMSGYTADVPTELGTEGAAAFLSKPFNEHALTSKLREVLDTPGP
jgi:PAS domain S-box-containing protein